MLRGKHDQLVTKLDELQSRVRGRRSKGPSFDPENLEDMFALANSRSRVSAQDSAILKEVVVRTLATVHEQRAHLLAGGATPSDKVRTSLVSPPDAPDGYTIKHVQLGEQYQTCIYLAFLSEVLAGPDDLIVTFNYDLVIEQALSRCFVGKKRVEPDYCLGPRSRSRPKLAGVRTSFPLLKIHGSINWSLGPSGRLRVTPADQFKVPQSPGRFKKVALVPPTWRKGDQGGAFDAIMERAIDEMTSADRIVIVGYSLPDSDQYFREALSRVLDRSRQPSIEVWDIRDEPAMKPNLEAMFGRDYARSLRHFAAGLRGLVEHGKPTAPDPVATLEYQPTGIADLDALLPDRKAEGGGGFRASQSGFFTVISGAAGTGKSILAMELACAFAGHERTAIYVTQDAYDSRQLRGQKCSIRIARER